MKKGAREQALRMSCSGLLPLEPQAFVGHAYRLLLGRPADPKGYAGMLRQFDRGLTQRSALIGLLNSTEARAHLGEAAQGLARELAAAPHRRAWEALRKAWHRVKKAQPYTSVQLPALRVGTLPTHWPELRPKAEPGLKNPSQQRQAFFTISTGNYLPRVRVLMRSLRRTHADCARYAVIVGHGTHRETQAIEGAAESGLFEVLDARELGVPAFDDMCLRYGLVELCTALKPFAIGHLWQHLGFEQVVYLDPDVLVLGRMVELDRLLEAGRSVVMTPHITQPLCGPGEPDDHSFLQSGVFNLGFVALRRCPAATEFVSWWGRQLQTEAVIDFQHNLFTDQRWCDLAPCLVDGFAVLRDQGYNVAYWNLEHRAVQSAAAGSWTVSGRPLVFFHYSGFDPRQPDRLSRFQTRLGPEALRAVQPLLEHYAALIADEESALGTGDAAENYTPPLPDLMRRYYRHRHPAPVYAGPPEALQAFLKRAWTPIDGVPDLLRFLHASRNDLVGHFELEEPTGRARFLAWFVHAGVHEPALVDLTLAAGVTA